MTTDQPPCRPNDDRGRPDRPSRSGRRRSYIITALIVIACLTSAAIPVAVWARTTALDTDTYVDTVTPLPKDPAFSAALAENAVDLVLVDDEVEQRLAERLPPDLTPLAGPTARALRDVVTGTADNFVSSDQFQATWIAINRQAHPRAVDVVTGRSNLSVDDQGQVVVDLTDLAEAVRSQVMEAGFADLLPPPRGEAAEIVLFEVGQAGLLQRIVNLLDRLYWALPLLTVLALASAVWLSDDRRRTWLHIGVGLAITMVCSLVLLELARSAVLDQIEDPINQAGIAALWDRLSNNLKTYQVTLLLASLTLATIAFLSRARRRDSIKDPG